MTGIDPGKDPDAGKDWGQEEKGATEDAMVGWHHWLNRHESEQTLGNSETQGSLACFSPWGLKELEMTSWMNNRKQNYNIQQGIRCPHKTDPELAWVCLDHGDPRPGSRNSGAEASSGVGVRDSTPQEGLEGDREMLGWTFPRPLLPSGWGLEFLPLERPALDLANISIGCHCWHVSELDFPPERCFCGEGGSGSGLERIQMKDGGRAGGHGWCRGGEGHHETRMPKMSEFSTPNEHLFHQLVYG